MTRILTMLLLLCFGNNVAFAQQVPPKKAIDSTTLALIRAKVMLNPKSKYYNPYQAFSLYRQYANRGNAKAMNALANLYNTGLGTAEDEREALNWYEKAANAGYNNAWYNLGCMYKAGIGVPQNFEKAYQVFAKGAAVKNGSCLYAQGYMLYKGFGVPQDYNQAVLMFKKGAKVQNISSWFMLGLCYRNGYGITKNLDSAKFYLKKAAAFKDVRAANELESLEPEHAAIALAATPQPPATVAKPIDLKSGFQKVKQNLPKTSALEGEYEGYMVKFDWSGKNIIAQNVLRVNLKQQKNTLTGQWAEEGQEPLYINAEITDTALVFKQAIHAQTDHYHRKKKLKVEFKHSYLNVVQSKDTIYLSGNIEVYSPRVNEPEKPRLIMLMKTGVLPAELPLDANTAVANLVQEEQMDEAALHFLAYPNPFTTHTSLRYTLRRPANASILITDVRTGRTVYQRQQGLQKAGEYTIPLTLQELPGNYVVTLQYGRKLKSLIVIKN